MANADSSCSIPKFASKLASILSALLERTTQRNDSVVLPESRSISTTSLFHGQNKPAIAIRAYLQRIFRYTGCSPCCFLIAYIYLDRLAHYCPEAVVDSYSIHRLLITSVMVAAKFMDDLHYSNAYYARIGGVEVSEMNCLELEFLFGMRFELNVSPDQFRSYCAMLEAEMCLESVPSIPKLHCLSSEEEHEEENGAKPTTTIQVQRQVEISNC